MLVGLSHEWLEGKRAHKSAPMVALYWLLKRLLTYWFMSEVLPTLEGHSLRCMEVVDGQPYDAPAIAQNDNLRDASARR